MASRRVKKKVNVRVNLTSRPRKNTKRAGKSRANMGVLSDPRVAAWDQLLRDPCSANLATPCYAGMDSGYLVRTTDIVNLTGGAPTGTVGASARLDGIVQLTPFNYSTTTGITYTGIGAGGALPAFVQFGVANFVTDNTTVSRYRPVAACVKFIPTGRYSDRQGSVGLGYNSGQVFPPTSTPTIQQALIESQRITPCGSEVHEIRWLPTAVDENFTDVSAASNAGAGTILLALNGVDATYTTTTNIQVNGYVEVTVVWEWTPARQSGATPSPKAPLPYTSQQVLSTIGDLGAYLFHGVRTYGPGIIQAATQASMRYLTNGMGLTTVRGPNMLTQR